MVNQALLELAMRNASSRELTRRHLNRSNFATHSDSTARVSQGYQDLSSSLSEKTLSKPASPLDPIVPNFGSPESIKLTVTIHKAVKGTRHKPYPSRPPRGLRSPPLRRPKPVPLHPLHCTCSYCAELNLYELSKWIASALHEYLFVDVENRYTCISNWSPSERHIRNIANIVSMYEPDPPVIFVALYYMTLLLPHGFVDLWLKPTEEEDLITRVFCICMILALKWCTDPDPTFVSRVWATICPTAPPFKDFERRALDILDYNLNISAEEWDAWTSGLMNTMRRRSDYGQDQGRRVARLFLHEVMSKETLRNSRMRSSRTLCTVAAGARFEAILMQNLNLPSTYSDPTPSSLYNNSPSHSTTPISDSKRVVRVPLLQRPLGTAKRLGSSSSQRRTTS